MTYFKNKLRLNYGKTTVQLKLNVPHEVIVPKEPSTSVDIQDFKEQIKTRVSKHNPKNIAIIVSDKTRKCHYDKFLPILTQELIHLGYAHPNITFFIAYGTHPNQGEKTCYDIYGDTYRKFKFIHHDANNPNLFASCGKTKRGTPISIRKDIINKDLVILFGAISHHYFAGFGGGRKLIFPGLGEQQAILQNHLLFLDVKNKRLHKNCYSGNLNNNPVAEDLKEFTAHFPPYFCINPLLDHTSEVREISYSDSYAEFAETCERYSKFYGIEQKNEYDLVIASCGGYPKDINFIQAHKSIHSTSAFVKNGGTLLLFSECVDGMGSDSLLPLFNTPYEELFDEMTQDYLGNGGTALSMMEKTRRINIYLVTKLPKNTCSALNTAKLRKNKVEDFISSLNAESIAIIPNASMIYVKKSCLIKDSSHNLNPN